MKSFVVIGLGRFGSNLARILYSLGNEVLGIDEDAERVQKISDYVTHSVVGDARDENVLKSLGVRNFDCIIVSLSGDMESNVLVTLMLKELGCKYVLAKAQSELHMRVLTKVGADRVVFPEKDMGMRVAHSLTTSNVLDIIELSREYSVVEIKVPKAWLNRSLREMNVRVNYGVNIVGVIHDTAENLNITPDPDYKFAETDRLLIVGANDDIKKITE